ncbi:MAG: Fe-S cluster assembly ATPase SufC [bacterium]
MALVEIDDLHVEVDDTQILRGVDLSIPEDRTHAIMGPNGSGKSTLAYTIMGHPVYDVTQGDIRYKGESILDWEADERAEEGVFLAFQYPSEISGISINNFLKTALEEQRDEEIDVMEFQDLLKSKMEMLDIDPSFATRYLNQGFSGGEKKRAEILQMAVLEPEFAVLDETDSGLDIDALKVVSDGIKTVQDEQDMMSVLMITHYQRILDYVEPDRIHVMMDGQIVTAGDAELAHDLEDKGYDWIREEFAA